MTTSCLYFKNKICIELITDDEDKDCDSCIMLKLYKEQVCDILDSKLCNYYQGKVLCHYKNTHGVGYCPYKVNEIENKN